MSDMSNQTDLRFAGTSYKPPPPKFVKKVEKAYQYGEIHVDHVDRKKDTYKVIGTAKSLSEAMALNGMEALCSGVSSAV